MGQNSRPAPESTAGSGRQESRAPDGCRQFLQWERVPILKSAVPGDGGRGLWLVHMASRVLLSPLQQGEYKQAPSPEDTSFTAKLDELRKAFLERPGCPQFSTKATSMSHYGESRPRGGPRPWKRPPSQEERDDLPDPGQPEPRPVVGTPCARRSSGRSAHG